MTNASVNIKFAGTDDVVILDNNYKVKASPTTINVEQSNTNSVHSNSCKKCIMCSKDIEETSSNTLTPQVQPSPVRNQPQPQPLGSF